MCQDPGHIGVLVWQWDGRQSCVPSHLSLHPGPSSLWGSLPASAGGGGRRGRAPLLVSDLLASSGELSARPSEGSERAPGHRRGINETPDDTHLLQGGVACGDPHISELPPPPSCFFLPRKELIRRKSPPRRTRERDLRRECQALAASPRQRRVPAPRFGSPPHRPRAPDRAALPRVRATATKR